MTAEVVEATVESTLPALLVADRCDYCGAQAFVAVRLESGTLLFCGHDFAKHEDVLRKQATDIRDDRHLINAQPSVSANAL